MQFSGVQWEIRTFDNVLLAVGQTNQYPTSAFSSSRVNRPPQPFEISAGQWVINETSGVGQSWPYSQIIAYQLTTRTKGSSHTGIAQGIDEQRIDEEQGETIENTNQTVGNNRGGDNGKNEFNDSDEEDENNGDVHFAKPPPIPLDDLLRFWEMAEVSLRFPVVYARHKGAFNNRLSCLRNKREFVKMLAKTERLWNDNAMAMVLSPSDLVDLLRNHSIFLKGRGLQ